MADTKMTCDTSLAIRQLKELEERLWQGMVEQVQKDVAAWPAAIKSKLKYVRPGIVTRTLESAIFGSVLHEEDEIGVGVLIDSGLAPHWTSIEYGSREVAHGGDIVKPKWGWPRRVRMASRTKPLFGIFTADGRSGKFVSAKNMVKKADADTGHIGPNILQRMAQTSRNLEHVDLHYDFTEAIDAKIDREREAKKSGKKEKDDQEPQRYWIEKNIQPHGFVRKGFKQARKRTLDALKADFKGIRLGHLKG